MSENSSQSSPCSGDPPANPPSEQRPHQALSILERALKSRGHATPRPAALRIHVPNASGMKRPLRRVPNQDQLRVLEQMLEVTGPPLVKAPRIVVGHESTAANF